MTKTIVIPLRAELGGLLGTVLRKGFQEALLPWNYRRSYQSRSGETVGSANSIAFKLLLYNLSLDFQRVLAARRVSQPRRDIPGRRKLSKEGCKL